MNLAKILPLYLLVFLLNGCTPIFIERNFKGVVLDDVTKSPIKNAVILAEWYRSFWFPDPAGGKTEYYYEDCYTTLSAEDGFFEIPGKWPRIFTMLDKMYVTVFKTGFTKSYLITGEDYSMKWFKKDSSGNTIVYLKELTLEQRKKSISADPGLPPEEAPIEKILPYLIELNRDRIWQGYSPRKSWNNQLIIMPSNQQEQYEGET